MSYNQPQTLNPKPLVSFCSQFTSMCMLRNKKHAVSESILGCSSSSCRCSCPIFFLINEILWITSESCCYGYGYMLSAISDWSCWSKKVGWFVLLWLSCSRLWIFYLNCWVNSHSPLSSAALVVIHSKMTEKKVANHTHGSQSETSQQVI